MNRYLALVAHDGKKREMVELVGSCLPAVRNHQLVATEATGRAIAESYGLDVELVLSGPFGGDMQIGAMVARGEVGMVVFLRDPLTAHPHDPDIHALMKVCDVHRVPLATNVATAQLCLRSPRPQPRAALVASRH